MVSVSGARHSRVNASTTLGIGIIHPVARSSTMKSFAHSWLGRIGRGVRRYPHKTSYHSLAQTKVIASRSIVLPVKGCGSLKDPGGAR